MLIGGAALVLLIRALIPSAGEIDASSIAREPSVQEAAVVAHAPLDAGVPVPVAHVEDVVVPTPVVVQPIAEPVLAQAPTPQSADAGFVEPAMITETPGPIEPIASIRPDIDRLRAQVEAIRASAADGGPSARNPLLQPMALLVNGAPIVRRLTAGDPTFADQVNRYRAALARAGSLDANARAALRSSIFTAAYAERAAAYDEILALTR
jgi:hypothetical protein